MKIENGFCFNEKFDEMLLNSNNNNSNNNNNNINNCKDYNRKMLL